jgi:hypothetical protein
VSIHPREVVARYLVHKKGYFSEIEDRIKRRAFMPDPIDNETSVYRIQGADESLIWAIGRYRVADPQEKHLYGRADIAASDVTDVGVVTNVSLQLSTEWGPPRHAAITGWPLEESLKISIAQELAERAKLRMKPA